MANTRTVTIVDPTAEDVAERFARAPRLASLEGRTIGLIDNYLFEHARMPVGDLLDRGYDTSKGFPRWIDASDPGTRVPIVASPDDFILVVAGGDGRHSAWMPAWSVCRGATEPVEE